MTDRSKIIFVINVAIILIDRRHSGVLPVLLKDTRLKGFVYHICQWENLPIEIYGADSLNKTRSIPNISLVDLLGRDSKYVFNIFIRHLLETKNMNTFWTFLETIVVKIVKFWFPFVTNIGKTVIEIIRRNVTNNMWVIIFTRYESFYFRPYFRSHFCRLYRYYWNRHYFDPCYYTLLYSVDYGDIAIILNHCFV